MNLPFQVKRIAANMQRELDVLHTVLKFEIDAHLTHAQRNGLDMLIDHIVDRVEIHVRTLQNHAHKMVEQKYQPSTDHENEPIIESGCD